MQAYTFVSAELAKLGEEKVSLLRSLQIYHFHPGNCRKKNRPSNFHWNYELWYM